MNDGFRGWCVGICLAIALATAGAVSAAAEPAADRGVGPIKEVKVGALDSALAKQGAQVFEQKCSACHKLDERYVGPPLKGVTQKQAPEWVMNMILNPQGMTAENATAQQLLGEFMVQMTFQNVSEADARAILEFLRQSDGAK